MAREAIVQLPKYWTIGKAERDNIIKALKKPLSGYVGGQPTEGYWVNRLADEWKQTFNTSYAIPCNSATSGLMAACMAAGISEGDLVWVSTYTMSASATAPMMLGATVKFLDIDQTYFCLTETVYKPFPKAIIVTNLFGCTTQLAELKSWCVQHNIILIEDNAQAPFATYGGKYAGTYGHIGVFSLNVHKHIQCGEGGVIVTDRPDLADGVEHAINHGELAGGGLRRISRMGGNFRMTEPIAAIACAQLKKGKQLVQTRIDLAHEISDIFNEVSFVTPPQVRSGDVHAFYLWAGKIEGDGVCDIRHALVTRLAARGIPFREGYSPLLHRLFEEGTSLPIAEDMEDNRLFTFEVCAYDPKAHHLRLMRDIILKEAENVEGKSQRGDGGIKSLSGSHGVDLR